MNIGGVANITVVAPGGEPLAWDTGPGNALIDDLMFSRTGASLDKDGAAALGGKVDDAALAALMAHPFFAVKPPKSLDRNAFSRSAVGNLTTGDAAATLAAFTAQSIADSLKFAPSKPAVLVVCGGGAHNPVIMRELARRSNIPVNGAATFGWSIDAMEAQAFGYLAVRALDGSPITFPSTTGAPRPLTGGVIHLP